MHHSAEDEREFARGLAAASLFYALRSVFAG